MMMQKITFKQLAVVIFAGVLSVVTTLHASQPLVKIATNFNYEMLMKDILAGAEPHEFTNFSHPKMRRGLVDYILISKALYLGGYKHKLEQVSSPHYTRALMMVNNGVTAIMSETVWGRSVDDALVYVSSPIIKKGWIEKGVYCLKERDDVRRVKTLSELRSFTTLCSSNWVTDWEMITKLELPVHDITLSVSMLRMLKRGHADYLFLPFPSSPDLVFQVYPYEEEIDSFEGFFLFPVPGIKLQLLGARHFVVSKSVPNASQIYAALQRGVALLHKEGAIRQAYIDCGVINEAVIDWDVLNP